MAWRCTAVTKVRIPEFQQTVLEYYRDFGRHSLPWRQTYDAYAILVSEIMLQQTQVSRVFAKYEAWMARFPTIRSLAKAELGELLQLWVGLGYNRRAKFLWQSSQMIEQDFDGIIPNTVELLSLLPGVGKNTAGAIVAYAFNQPVVFIETNIRTVYIHHFFNNLSAGSGVKISDAEIAVLVAKTLPDGDVRTWYWALMDYGSMLKSSGVKSHISSAGYAKQTKFVGSTRQIRGMVLRLLSIGPQTGLELERHIADDRLSAILDQLQSEQLIQKRAEIYSL